MFHLGKKHKIYRIYNNDLWAVLRKKQVFNRTFSYLVKQFKERKQPLSPFSKSSVVKRHKKTTLYGELLNYRKKLFYFYGALDSNKGLSTLNAETQRLHLFFSTIIGWELRLSTVLYRLNYCDTTVEAIYFVLSGAVSVNREVLRDTAYAVKPGDVIEITESFKTFFFKRFRAKLDKIVLLQPKYFETNFTTLTAILLYVPAPKDVYYPFEASLSLGAYN